MTLYLHLGPSKTASTLLQRMLVEAAPENIVYPQYGRADQRNAHHLFAWDMSGKQTILGQEERWTLLTEDLLSRPSVFLSSEDFPANPKVAARAIKAGRDAGHEIVAVFVVRDPIARLNSMYSQSVKTLKFRKTLRDYTQTLENRFLISSFVIPKWNKAVDRFILLPYLPRRQEAVYQNFLDHIGVPIDPLSIESMMSDAGVVNRAPSAYALEMCLKHGSALQRKGYMAQFMKLDREFNLEGFFGSTPEMIQELRTLLATEYDGISFPDYVWPEGISSQDRSIWQSEYPDANNIIDTQLFAEYETKFLLWCTEQKT